MTLCRAEQLDAAMGGAVRDALLLEPAMPSATRHVVVGLCFNHPATDVDGALAESLATRILAARWPVGGGLIVLHCGQS